VEEAVFFGMEKSVGNIFKRKLFKMEDLELMEHSGINRALRRTSWWLVLLAIILSIIGVVGTSVLNKKIFIHDLVNYVFFQSLYVIVIQIITEVLCKRFKKWADYIGILGLFTILNVFIMFNPNVKGFHFILFLVIILSTLYFQYKKVYFSSGLCLGSIVFFFLFYKSTSNYLMMIDLLACVGTYIACTFISIAVIRRGKFLLKHLEKSHKNQQELLVRNILMDRESKIEPLTDLYNHKTFHEYLEGLIEQSDSNQLPLQLALIDIDNFKTVNDQYGHWVGDIILKRVSNQLKVHITPNDFASRYGGEEFAVIFTEKSIHESYELIEHFRKSVSSIIHEELNNKPVTVSIGMSSYTKGRGKECFFRETDECLYKAKNNGKNQTVLANTGA
jgi:diguanylate cyclase (GGDEF)-like protein